MESTDALFPVYTLGVAETIEASRKVESLAPRAVHNVKGPGMVKPSLAVAGTDNTSTKGANIYNVE